MTCITTDSRRLSTLVGCIILGAATNATILKTGGYYSSNAILVAALSVGVFAGARVIGIAWKHSAVLAGAIICALVAGEIYNLFGTAERTIMMREEQAAPLKALAQKRKEALDNLARLEAGDIVSPRVKIAQETLAKAQKAVDIESQNGGCRRECQRKQAVADKAAQDLKSAIKEAEASTEQDIADAKAEVERNPVPESATPFADRLGWAPWVLDLIFAGLLSLGANGLAGALIAFGSHSEQPERFVSIPRSRPIPQVPVPNPPEPPRGNRGARSDYQVKANLIAKEMRDAGIEPRFQVVKSEFQRRYNTELPNVTAHRASRIA